jgi:hypothetical protein
MELKSTIATISCFFSSLVGDFVAIDYTGYLTNGQVSVYQSYENMLVENDT